MKQYNSTILNADLEIKDKQPQKSIFYMKKKFTENTFFLNQHFIVSSKINIPRTGFSCPPSVFESLLAKVI